ncbi:MAG: DUF3103 family protein [Pseudomonadota bacterium]|uniref:DUF3103 family protein n=1 Tax=Gallaecimonas pentaromativorans TaxID=584787 RepID=UPI00067F63FD|nr:DUF3103 family protein [Gallaecimonas pentaromativorans]MED5526892.1 DUF3103 family protein [Pseudomonadota bacterium]
MNKTLLLTLVASLCSAPALAANSDRQLALDLARDLGQWQPATVAKDYAVPLGTLIKQHHLDALATEAAQRELAVQAKRGLTGKVDSLMQVRLAHPSMKAALDKGAAPLVAYVPDGDESQWSAIEAFAADGSSQMLDVHQLPARPVFVVGQDGRKAQSAGLKLVRQALVEAGLSSPVVSADTAPLSTTLVQSIRANDVQEPWLLGNAEVFAVVAGIDPFADEPQVDIVDMPYLDDEDKTYYPNQVLVYWDRYRWGAADVVFFEQDSDYNFQDLASLLVQVLGQALSAGGVPEALPFAQLGQQIIKAMPSNWFSNDDDYLDAFYTLEQNQVYSNYPGASGNIRVNLVPKTINPTQ